MLRLLSKFSVEILHEMCAADLEIWKRGRKKVCISSVFTSIYCWARQAPTRIDGPRGQDR